MENSHSNSLIIANYYCKEDMSSFILKIHSLLKPGPIAVETSLSPIPDKVRDVHLSLG